jgi:hypothetical protein
MAVISIGTEQELVTRLLSGPRTREFRDSRLAPKVARERQARALLEQAEGRYTADSLNHLFDTVDYEELTGRPWFGQLLSAPNRNQMFESGPDPVGRWIDELLFSGHDFQHSLDACATDLKVKGAGKGLATLLLYLADPLAYNVCVPATERGLELLGRIPQQRSKEWGASYAQFNEAAIGFRDHFGLLPQEVDWALFLVQDCIQADKGRFLVDSKDVGLAEPPPEQAASAPVPRRTSICNRIVRDTAVAQGVKRMHNHRCQVCGHRLETPGGPYAEAAHVRPLGSPHHGPDEAANVLCLCPTHHVLFDVGAFSVAEDLRLIARSDLNVPDLRTHLRQAPGHEIAVDHLRHHRSYFGFPS